MLGRNIYFTHLNHRTWVKGKIMYRRVPYFEWYEIRIGKTGINKIGQHSDANHV